MKISDEDYIRIGKAVVDRLHKARTHEHSPFTITSGDFVTRRGDGGLDMRITICRYCPGCGLDLRLETKNQTLAVGFEPDFIGLSKYTAP